jgi:hypothetical protein
MDRRTFLGRATLGLVVAPLVAEAQSAGKVWRIGVIGFAPTTADMVGPPAVRHSSPLEGLRARVVYGHS